MTRMTADDREILQGALLEELDNAPGTAWELYDTHVGQWFTYGQIRRQLYNLRKLGLVRFRNAKWYLRRGRS